MHFTKINLLNNSPVSVSVPCDMFLYFSLLSNVKCVNVTYWMQGFILFIFSRKFCYPTYVKALPQGPIPYPVTYHFWQITVEPLALRHLYSSNTSIWGTQNLVPEKCSHISVFVTSIEGKPLFRGKGHFFWVQTLVWPLFRGYLSNQQVTDDKNRCVFTSHNGDSLQNMY